MAMVTRFTICAMTCTQLVLGATVPAPRDLFVRQEQKECGPGVGKCGSGLCCSEFGFCGTSNDFCGPRCQVEYGDKCQTQQQPSPGIDTSQIPRPHIGNVPYGPSILTCTSPGLVALTYDDGPYEYTSQLLDILDRHGAKATFFITGDNHEKPYIDEESSPWPGVLRQMHSAGHHIASHTWSHLNLDQSSEDVRRSELLRNENAFRNIFGWIPTYIRAPFLECSAATGCEKTMSDLGYHVISTNLDTKDYEHDSPSLIQQSKDMFSNGLSTDKSNSYIVLAHDPHQQTVQSLTEFMIQTSKDRGYKLVTVGECLGDPAGNWYRSAPSGKESGKGRTAATAMTSATNTGDRPVSRPLGAMEDNKKITNGVSVGVTKSEKGSGTKTTQLPSRVLAGIVGLLGVYAAF